MTEIKFRQASMDAGKLVIDLPFDQRGPVMNWLRKKKDRDYDLVIKEHQKKRSRDANAYAWVLIHELATVLRHTPEEIYRQLVVDVGDNYVPMCIRDEDLERHKAIWESHGIGWVTEELGPARNSPGCTTVFCYYGSSQFSVSQMSKLIDLAVQDCKALGIETMPPYKLAALLGEWDA
jgi:hypothetical protein